MARPRPLDEQFEDTYSQRASIKPSSGAISRTRNVKVDKRNPNQRRDNQGRVVEGRRKSANTSNQVVATTPKKSNVVNLDDYREEEAQQAVPQTNVQTRQNNVVPMRRQPKPRPSKTKEVKIKKKGRAKKMARRKARVVNAAARGPLLFAYFTFQLPFAIISIILLGFAYISLELKDLLTPEDEGGFWDKVWNGIVLAAGAIGDAVSNVVFELSGGTIDLGAIFEGVWNLPENFLITAMSLMLAYGIILLLTLGLTYQFAGIKSLSGKSSGAKVGAFIACLFGYFWPIFSLFPWVFIWMYVVRKNPT